MTTRCMVTASNHSGDKTCGLNGPRYPIEAGMNDSTERPGFFKEES